MKIFITGPVRGLGYRLVHDLSDTHEVETNGEYSVIESLDVNPDILDSDVLINNAFYYTSKPIYLTDIYDYEKFIDTNLRTQFKLLKAFYEAYKNRGCGKIINISSLVCKHPNKNEPLYGMAKMAQKGLCESIQLDAVESNVNICNVLIGAMENHGGDIKFRDVSSIIKFLVETEIKSCFPSEIVIRR